MTSLCFRKFLQKPKGGGPLARYFFGIFRYPDFVICQSFFSIILVFPGFLVCRRSWAPQLYCESALISASVCVAFLLLACRCSAASPPPTAETVGKASRWRFLACRVFCPLGASRLLFSGQLPDALGKTSRYNLHALPCLCDLGSLV